MAYYYMGLGQQPINSAHLTTDFSRSLQRSGSPSGATSQRIRHPQHTNRMQPKHSGMNAYQGISAWGDYQTMQYHPGRPN